MGGEDFSYMLEARPGAFIFIGNGDTAGLHHPAYDFNDEAIPIGVLLLGEDRRDGHAGAVGAAHHRERRRRAARGGAFSFVDAYIRSMQHHCVNGWT